MTIEAGQQLLHYRLIEKIGEGGMGVVWKALDTSLDREVAIKVLAENVAADSWRIARFEREAKLLASLKHAQSHRVRPGTGGGTPVPPPPLFLQDWGGLEGTPGDWGGQQVER